jgi:hypothetical protein
MGETNRGVILMRHQEKELDLLVENTKESSGESANRARRPLTCWNCRKPIIDNKISEISQQTSIRTEDAVTAGAVATTVVATVNVF